MARFRKRPVVVDAVRWDGTNCEEVFAFLGYEHEPHDEEIDEILVHTWEGTTTASTGDWVIRGVAGEYYPCKDAVFRSTYEEVAVAVPTTTQTRRAPMPPDTTTASAEVLHALADCVVKATEFGEQDGGFVASYIVPTGPVHRAIPLLERHGITVRPGFDGRMILGQPDTDSERGLTDG